MSDTTKKVRRIAYLTDDARIFNDSVQLSYRRRGFSSLGSGPPMAICPPVEKFKKGTKLRLTLVGQKITKVELA